MALVDQIIGVESGGDPNNRNPNSSASGLGQFIDSTWLSMLEKHRPDLAQSMSKDDLLALKTDPALSRAMTEAYASDNGAILQNAGLPVTPGSTYLAHFAGPQGAVKVLQADPNAPVSSVLGDGAVKANPFLSGMTVAGLQAWADRKMGGKQSAPASPAAPLNAPSQQPVAPLNLGAQPAPIFPQAAPGIPQQAPPQQAGGSLYASMPPPPTLPPIFGDDPPKPIDLSKLRAALQARPQGGFFLARKG